LWDNTSFLQSDEGNRDVEEELLAFQNENGTRTTIIVKSRGDIDIMISPLVLESLQRFALILVVNSKLIFVLSDT